MGMHAVVCFVVFACAAAQSNTTNPLKDQHPLQCNAYHDFDPSVSATCHCGEACCPAPPGGGCSCGGYSIDGSPNICGCSMRGAYGTRPDNCPENPPPAQPDDLIGEFNDPDMGIGFSMINQATWEHPGNGAGNNHMDAAGFYPLSEVSEYHGQHQQAVTVITSQFDMNPYDGGYGTWGLAFHLTEKHEFWKYFQVIGYGKTYKGWNLVAGPGDGASHTPGTGDWRISIQKAGTTYDSFTANKNAILAQYNTVYHNHDYNEFDTNGLSPESLAGVFVNEQSGSKSGPSEQVMCNFLMHADPSRSTWPVYGYKWYKLYLKDTLNCGSYVAASSAAPADTVGQNVVV